MDTVWAVIIIAVFFLYAACVIRNAKYRIEEDNSISSKICTGIAYCIALSLIIYCSLQIKPEDNWGLRGVKSGPFNFESVIVYLFYCGFFATLLGSMFGVIQLCALVLIYSVKHGVPNWRDHIPGGEVSVLTSIEAISLVVAYSTILWAFGMTDSLTFVDMIT